MATYYRINLRDKQGNICYPNIDPNITIDTEGNTTIKSKLFVQKGLDVEQTSSTTPFAIFRHQSGDDENVYHYIEDKYYEIKYTNDETNNFIRFTLINTDAENSDGSRANTSVITFGGSGGGSIITADYLTLTKSLSIGGDQYYTNDKYGIHMHNSDIVGLNSIWFADYADDCYEGLHFVRSDGDYNSLWGRDGKLFWSSSHSLTSNPSNNYNIITSAGGTMIGDLYFANGTSYYAGSNGNCKFKTGAFTEGLTVSTYSATINSQRIMLAQSDGTYWGLMHPNGEIGGYVRSTQNGFLPYNAKDASAGRKNSYLGTSGWPFYACYADNFYGNLSGNASSATNSTYAYYTISQDTRDTNPGCADLTKGMGFHFKNSSKIGSPRNTQTYGGLLTLKPWADKSGGDIYQIFAGSDGDWYPALSIRKSLGAWTGWRAWYGIPLSDGSTVRNLYATSISTWNSNYTNYLNGTVCFCW